MLDCSDNQIGNLNNLPSELQELYCSDYKITNLDNVPSKLQY
jgi:hypothetical protein